MKELAIAPEEDFLLFVHMLDLIDAYGYIDMMDRIVTGVLNSDNHLDDEDHEILESYIMPVESQTEYDSLKEIREDFLDIAEELNLSAVTAENIVDALIDYFERNLSEGVTDKIILEEKSFRNYIIGLLDIEYMDTYEYAAMVLWGSVYLIDLMKKRGQMTAEDADKSLEIIRKIKAFIMIKIGRAHV